VARQPRAALSFVKKEFKARRFATIQQAAFPYLLDPRSSQSQRQEAKRAKRHAPRSSSKAVSTSQ
jgi:hypothetical protein